MFKINKLNELGNAGRAVTFGKFDGIHSGHRMLMDKIKEQQAQGLLPTVFTFDRAPTEFVSVAANDNETANTAENATPKANAKTNANAYLNVNEKSDLNGSLLTLQEREQFLADFGIDTLFEYSVTKENMSVAADEFVNNIVKNSLHAKYIAVGEDFRFGYKRQGDAALLAKMAESCGYVLEVVEKKLMNNDIISSSRIKSELQSGNIENVNEMLGYTYFVQGTIVKGNQLGRTWDIPTINVIWPTGKMLPKFGVYYSEVIIDDKKYFGMTNIGIKPSIEGSYMPLSETYLYNCNENLYGRSAKVNLLHFRRSEQKFDSLELLISQLKADIAAGEKVFLL